jgi:hypothetical protein
MQKISENLKYKAAITLSLKLSVAIKTRILVLKLAQARFSYYKTYF